MSIGGKGGSFGALSTVVGATGGAALGAGEVAGAGGGGGAGGFAPGFDGADFWAFVVTVGLAPERGAGRGVCALAVASESRNAPAWQPAAKA